MASFCGPLVVSQLQLRLAEPTYTNGVNWEWWELVPLLSALSLSRLAICWVLPVSLAWDCLDLPRDRPGELPMEFHKGILLRLSYLGTSRSADHRLRWIQSTPYGVWRPSYRLQMPYHLHTRKIICDCLPFGFVVSPVDKYPHTGLLKWPLALVGPHVYLGGLSISKGGFWWPRRPGLLRTPIIAKSCYVRLSWCPLRDDAPSH